MPNRLAGETSPYLLQHAHNPVDWYPWGPEALERARSEDKPIFLSIGYSACHWCHVMERESFENPEIAALHERALRLDQGRPRGAAGPRRDLHGRRAGDDRLRRLADVRLPDPGPRAVLRRHVLPARGSARDARLPARPRRGRRCVPDASRPRSRPRRARWPTTSGRSSSFRPARRDVEPPQLEAAVARLAATFDAAHGGFGGAPKFPPPMVARVPAPRVAAHRATTRRSGW